MDAQARNKIGALKPEDWVKLGYSNSTTANNAAEGLSNEIDPIFRFRHPSRTTPIWASLNEAQYNDLLVDLKPMLQLASLLLRSSPSLNADYDLLYSPRVHPAERVTFEDRPVLEFHHVDTTKDYWPKRKELANAALDRLAGGITFLIASEEQNPQVKGTNGYTEITFRYNPQGVNIQDDTGLSKGMGSQIWIHDRFLTEFRRLRTEKGVDNSLKIASLTVKGAAMLCHELFHAKNNAVDSTVLADSLVETSLRNYEKMRKTGRQESIAGTEEPLFEDDTDAEIGYVWEKYVFGGHIHRVADSATCLWFSKWPSYWTSTDYHRRGGWRRKMTRYVVPMHYILNLLRQSFWENMEDADLTALLIKKWIGIRMNCPYPDLVDSDWQTDDSSEGEYPLVRPSLPRVCREKSGKVLAEPSIKARANEPRQARLDRELLEQRGSTQLAWR